MKTNIIYPYRLNGLWVFDDAETGLVQEPFVLGSSEILDEMVDNPETKRVEILFSDKNIFLGKNVHVFQKMYEEKGGCWYLSPTVNRSGWLCPQLYKYFPVAPEAIFAKMNKL